MGLGSTAKKVQRMVDVAEKLHSKFEDLRQKLEGVTETVEDTNDRVAALETELAEQRELLERIAAAEDVDVSIEDVDVEDTDTTRGDGNA